MKRSDIRRIKRAIAALNDLDKDIIFTPEVAELISRLHGNLSAMLPKDT